MSTHAQEFPKPGTFSVVYDRDGNVTSWCDAHGNVTTYCYDTRGRRGRRRPAGATSGQEGERRAGAAAK